MQLSLKIFLLIVGCLLADRQATSVWAQDALAESSVEQTTQVNSEEAGLTATETLDEAATTTSATSITFSCAEPTSGEIDDKCKCKCRYKDPCVKVTTTAATSVEQTTTAIPDEEIQQSAETTEVPSNSPVNGQPENLPSFNCESAGNFAHPNDCHRYFNCLPNVKSNEFELVENVCPDGQAFNAEFSTCMRDISTCGREHGGYECLGAGSFADPESNTAAYYRCVPRLGGETPAATFHVYHVNCGAGKIFMPELGKCFYDLNAPLTSFNSLEFNAMPDDEQLVKAEIKQWKVKEKTKLKEEKLKEKYEKKLQKELAKKATKEAKEKAKKEEKANKGKTYNYEDDDYD